MPQQPQATSQYIYGPVNQGGDIVHVIDKNNSLRGWVDGNNMSYGVSGVATAQPGTGAATAAAAAATVFTPTLNLPGNSAYDGVPFTVKASGWISLNGGTYTATVQPLIYASTSLGFTASAAAAVLSSAAVSLTIAVAATATLTNFPWEAEVTLVGSTATGIMGGRAITSVGPGSAGTTSPVPALAATANSPVSISFTSATPVQFLAGITTVGATISAEVVNLTSFFLES